MFQSILLVCMCRSQFVSTKMEKEYFIALLVEYVVVISLLHLMCSESLVKSGGINFNFIVKSICSIQKFQNQLDIIQSFRRNSNDRLQSRFLIILKNFIVNSLNLDDLVIIRFVMIWIIRKNYTNLYLFEIRFPISNLPNEIFSTIIDFPMLVTLLKYLQAAWQITEHILRR